MIRLGYRRDRLRFKLRGVVRDSVLAVTHDELPSLLHRPGIRLRNQREGTRRCPLPNRVVPESVVDQKCYNPPRCHILLRRSLELLVQSHCRLPAVGARRVVQVARTLERLAASKAHKRSRLNMHVNPADTREGSRAYHRGHDVVPTPRNSRALAASLLSTVSGKLNRNLADGELGVTADSPFDLFDQISDFRIGRSERI
jgi:hypothetical protein